MDYQREDEVVEKIAQAANQRLEQLSGIGLTAKNKASSKTQKMLTEEAAGER